MKPMIVIFNPASGSTSEDFRGQLESAFHKHSLDFEIQETTPEISGEILAYKAARAGAGHVMACGGDGTIMSVVNGLGRARTELSDFSTILSIIPGGTANLLATALDIPTDIEGAVETALSGQEKLIDLGQCGDKFFALGLGLGLTERLVSQASAREKESLGKLAYARAMLRELGARPSSFTFQLEEGARQRTRGVAVVVANSGQIGGNVHFAPDARMDDGQLDLCILHHFTLSDVVRLLWRSLFGQLHNDRAVTFYQARRIEIDAIPPLDLQIDGEVVDMTTPLCAQVLPGILTVRVPAE